MNSDTARLLLSSSNPDDRLKAARHFGEIARAEDLALLQGALRGEKVRWIRVALRKAILMASGGDDLPKDIAQAIRSDAVSEVTRRLVHEIAPIVGELRLSAREEIRDFETSKTGGELKRLAQMLDAMDRLGKAAAEPTLETVNLAELIDNTVKTEGGGFRGEIKTDGSRRLTVVTDRTLLQLGLSNALRNAIEATVEAFSGSQSSSVLITWGSTDVDTWISVIDNGGGFVGSSEGAFEYGFTKKQGHSGMGLPTAKQAMESLGGSISLAVGGTGGAVCVLRWPTSVEQQK
jgi:nitrogen fixation/metabolism regulation signal transduction histidine kinase